MLRCLWTSYDYLTGLKQTDDLVIGGITDLRMYFYPEPCKKSGGWTMRKVLSVEERLKAIPWPDTLGTMVDQPVEINLKYPHSLYMNEDASSIKIGVWDDDK